VIIIVYLQDATLLCFFRVAYRGCYPNVQEFVNCASADRPIKNDLYHTRIMWVKGGVHSEYITLNCREICKEIAEAKSRHIHHIRVNYEGEFGR
jgi:hypothetical protein